MKINCEKINCEIFQFTVEQCYDVQFNLKIMRKIVREL